MSVQQAKIKWLIDTGGKLIDDDADETVVEKDGMWAVVDKWGKVSWTPKKTNEIPIS